MAQLTKHGNARHGSVTKEYVAWRGMVGRCNGNYSRKYYLERGIKVCQEWIDSFPAFLAHIGPAPSSRHSVDRINSDLGYQPGNVRWATPRDQARNRSNGVYVTVDGTRMLLVEAAEKYSIGAKVVRDRIEDGWADEVALKTPTRKKRPPQHTATRPIERTRG